MTHWFVVHSANGVQPLIEYKNRERTLETVFESSAFPDGSMLVIISTYDAGVLLRLPNDVPGVTALPHPHSTRGMGQAAVKLHASLKAKSTDTTEAMLLNAIEGGLLHPRFHPDLF